MTAARDETGGQSNGADANVLLDRSLEALEAAAAEQDRGDLAEAERIVVGVKSELDEAIAEDPDNLIARQARGRVRETLGQRGDALADYAVVARLAPTAEAFCKVGDIHLDLQDLEAAHAAYTRALELVPGHVHALIGRGIVYGRRREYGLAEAEFSRALEVDPDDLAARRWRAVGRMAAGHYREAVADLEAVVEQAPAADVLCQLGDARFELEEDDSAEAAYERARALEPRHAHAWRSLGIMRVRRGESKEGLEYLTRSLELDPGNATTLAQRGEVRAAVDDLHGAEQDFSRALDLDPQYAWAYCGRGRVRGQTERYEEALEDFSRALDIDPGQLDARRLRGITYDRLGRYEEALADLEPVAEAGADAAAWCGVAEARWALADLTAAEAAFDRALELDPNLVRALMGRGAMLAARGEYGPAAEAFSRAIELDDGNANALALRAHTHLRMGQFEAALADYEAVIDAQPSADAFLDRAEALQAMDRLDDALVDCNRALQADPRSTRGLVVRGHLHSLLRRFELAIEDFSAALELDPASLPALRLRGIANEALARFDAALADYDAVARAAPSADAYLNRADAWAGLGDMEAAEADYSAALELDPESIKALVERGRARGRRGDNAGAEEDFTKAIELAPGNLEPRHLRGYVREILGRLPEALDDYEAVARAVPHAAVYCDIGDVQMSLGEFQAAREAFATALELEPSLARASFGKGTALALDNQLEAGLAELSAGLDGEPDNTRARRLRGSVLENLGRWEEALADYEVIVEESPSAEAFSDRGRARLAVGDEAGAEQDYARALEHDREFVDAYLGRGRLLAGRGEHGAARAEFDAAIGLDELNADAYVGRGDAAAALGDTEQAISDYDHALELEPAHVRALDGRSAARADIAEGFRGRRLGAKALDASRASLQDIDRALQLAPGDASLYAQRSSVLRDLLAYDDAVDCAESGLARAEGDTFTAVWLLGEQGESLRCWGEDLDMVPMLSRAVDVLETAMHTAGKEAPAWLPDALGLTLLALGRYPEAVARFEEAIALDESNAWAHVKLGRALYHLRDRPRARSAFQRALDMDEDEGLVLWGNVGRGLSLRGEGDAAEATRSLDAALGTEPATQDYLDRGQCLVVFRELDLAEADFLKAMDLDPGATRVENTLAWFYTDTELARERLPRALELARRAVDHAVDAMDLHDALDTLGWVLFKLGRAEDALEPLERARTYQPESLLYRWHVAEAEAALAVK